MSVKLFIDTKEVPAFTDRVDVTFDLAKRSKHTPHAILNPKTRKWELPPYGFLTLGQDHRFWFEDEWFDGNLGGILPLGDITYTPKWKVWFDFIDMPTKHQIEFLEALSELPDETIQGYMNGAWYRPVPYWKMYRMLTKDYLLAKRDYLRSLVEAEIVNVHVMAVYVDTDILHKKWINPNKVKT